MTARDRDMGMSREITHRDHLDRSTRWGVTAM
jgi:hypothetical protein